MNNEVYITDYNCITPLGFDVKSNMDALLSGKTGISLLKKIGLMEQDFQASIVKDENLENTFSKISDDKSFSKLEKMLLLALNPIINNYSITSKTALILSTTKGNIEALKNDENNISSAHLSQLAKKIAAFYAIKTEPIVVSNACVSGILAVSVAKKMIQSGLYDDAFIVAGDCVSEFILSGFNSFQALSEAPCKPYDKNRTGVTLGEATAAVYLTKTPKETNKVNFKIIGDGAINDANHISGPSRTGEGLYRSIISALDESGIQSIDIDYISAHGTATPFNDEMEAIAFNRLSLEDVPVNSLKGFYGHTLGASGLLETVISMEAAKQNLLIKSLGFSEMGVSQPISIINENKQKEIKYFLKTASGFGGCNTAVLFEKVSE